MERINQRENIIVINRKYSNDTTLAIDLFAKLIANDIINSERRKVCDNNLVEKIQTCREVC